MLFKKNYKEKRKPRYDHDLRLLIEHDPLVCLPNIVQVT